MTDPTAPWASMKTLVEKFSWQDTFTSMTSYIDSIVLKGFISGDLSQWQFVQTGDLIFLTVAFATTAYVVCQSVQAAYNANVYYWMYNYGDQQQWGTLLYAWEILLVGAW